MTEPRYAKYPSITVIRPIRGLDPGCRTNTLALLKQDYPGQRQTLFVFDSENDPAWPVVWDVIRRCAGSHDVRVMVGGPPPAHRTGKLNAMMFGLEHAQGELIAFSDSDTRPAPHMLRLLAEPLIEDPKVGAAFAPIVCYGEPQTSGDAGCALLVNSWYGASVSRAAQAGGLPFIMGELFVCSRRALRAIGGLQAAEGQLVDDMYLGACVHRAGLKNVMIPWKLPIVSSRLSFSEFTTLFRRWLLFSKSGLPAQFVGASWLRGTEYGLAVAAAIAALALGHPLAALVPAAAATLFVYSDFTLQRRFSGYRVPLRYWWVSAALPFLGGALLLASRLKPRVEWRGRTYALNSAARLAPAPLRGRPVATRYAPR